jgi:hypothetical protein
MSERGIYLADCGGAYPVFLKANEDELPAGYSLM